MDCEPKKMSDSPSQKKHKDKSKDKKRKHGSPTDEDNGSHKKVKREHFDDQQLVSEPQQLAELRMGLQESGTSHKVVLIFFSWTRSSSALCLSNLF
jgi:hypothetical protein